MLRHTSSHSPFRACAATLISAEILLIYRDEMDRCTEEIAWDVLREKPEPRTPAGWTTLVHTVSWDMPWICRRYDEIIRYVLDLPKPAQQEALSACRGVILARLLARGVVPPDRSGIRSWRPIEGLIAALTNGYHRPEDVDSTIHLLRLGHRPAVMTDYRNFIRHMAAFPVRDWFNIIRASLPLVSDRDALIGYLFRYLGPEHMLIWSLYQHHPSYFVRPYLAAQTLLRAVLSMDLQRYVLEAI